VKITLKTVLLIMVLVMLLGLLLTPCFIMAIFSQWPDLGGF
jgi:hypothetical protein